MKLPNIEEEVHYRIGKNAENNTELINLSAPSDIWFHLENRSSAHILVTLPKGLNKKQKKTVIKWGAILCKQKSSVKETCSIMYTRVENLTCTEKAGQVLVGEHYSTIEI